MNRGSVWVETDGQESPRHHAVVGEPGRASSQLIPMMALHLELLTSVVKDGEHLVGLADLTAIPIAVLISEVDEMGVNLGLPYQMLEINPGVCVAV